MRKMLTACAFVLLSHVFICVSWADTDDNVSKNVGLVNNAPNHQLACVYINIQRSLIDAATEATPARSKEQRRILGAMEAAYKKRFGGPCVDDRE